MKLCDIAALGDLADEYEATLVVDNGFATPYAQHPLELGADVSVLSTTKFANRHTDSVGGAIAATDGDLSEQLEFVLEELEVFNLAISLGGVESLVEHTASMSAASLSPEESADAGIAESLVRISVGLESPDDLLPDLTAALDRV